jgi:hypothetical protein
MLESDGPAGSSASECRCAASRRAAGSNGMANRDDMRTACGLRSGTRIRASERFASQLGSRNGKRQENSHHPLSELISPSVGTRPRERGRGGQSTRRPPRPASQPHGHRAPARPEPGPGMPPSIRFSARVARSRAGSHHPTSGRPLCHGRPFSSCTIRCASFCDVVSTSRMSPCLPTDTRVAAAA